MWKRAVVIGLLFVVAAWAQSFSANSAQIVVDVRPEAALGWQRNSTVLVKVRLAPGAQARVWAGESCGAVGDDAQVISASGTIPIELGSINGEGKLLVCLTSTDGRLNVSLAASRN